MNYCIYFSYILCIISPAHGILTHLEVDCDLSYCIHIILWTTWGPMFADTVGLLSSCRVLFIFPYTSHGVIKPLSDLELLLHCTPHLTPFVQTMSILNLPVKNSEPTALQHVFWLCMRYHHVTRGQEHQLFSPKIIHGKYQNDIKGPWIVYKTVFKSLLPAVLWLGHVSAYWPKVINMFIIESSLLLSSLFSILQKKADPCITTFPQMAFSNIVSLRYL